MECFKDSINFMTNYFIGVAAHTKVRPLPRLALDQSLTMFTAYSCFVVADVIIALELLLILSLLI